MFTGCQMPCRPEFATRLLSAVMKTLTMVFAAYQSRGFDDGFRQPAAHNADYNNAESDAELICSYWMRRCGHRSRQGSCQFDDTNEKDNDK